MMKRLLIFMQMLIAFAAGVSAQETLTVCDGTNTNASLPFAGAYNQDGAITSQMIYPAADLTAMNGKKITSITFYPTSALVWTNTDTWKMAEVEQTAFSSSALLDVTTTQVASTRGTKNSDNSWTIEFSTPYVYNGGNLMIQGEMPQGYDGNQTFYGVNQSGYTSCVKYNYWGSWTTDRVRFLPKVTFTYYEDNDGGDTGGGSTAYEGTATFDFTANPWNHEYGYMDKIQVTDETSGATLVFDKGLGGQVRYRNTTYGVYFYTNNEITLTAPTGSAISAITVTPYANDNSLLGIESANIVFVDPVSSYQFGITGTGGRWTKVEVTLVKAAGGDAGGFVIPEGYNEVANWTESFENFASTIKPNPGLGWAYIDGGFVESYYTTMFSKNSSYHTTGSYCLSITNTSSDPTKVNYVVTPALKGQVKMQARALSYAASYANTQYIKFYKVTKNEDGTFSVPTEEDLLATEDLGLDNTFHEIAPLNLDDYTYLAITGSRAYVDDITADYAVMPENPALQITAMTTEWAQESKIYADETGKGTWTGSIKVKNTGNVDLVAGRTNYSVTLTSQGSTTVSIPETIIPVSVDLAQGEETEIPLEVECQIIDLSKDGWTAIRATSNLIEYGLTNSSTLYNKLSPWFYVKNYSPKISVKEGVVGALDSYVLPFGLVSGSGSKTVTITNDGGSDAVITAIETTIPEGFSYDVQLPLTIAKAESADVVLTIGGNEGYKEGTVTFTYGDGFTYTTKNISATVIPEGTYLETFGTILTPEKTYVPDGWINEVGSNWEAAASSYNVHMQNSAQQYPTAMLVSPKITFAEGQSLTVGATSRTTSFYSSTDAYLQVYYSTDRQNWQLANVITYSKSNKKNSALKDVNDNDIADDAIIEWGSLNGTTVDKVKAYTINGIPAGDYYIGFRSGYALIDYIFGGQLAEVENDLYVDNFTVNPGKAMVNYDATASVTYRNMNDKAAAAHTVALYDGETLIEEKAGAELAAYASSTVDFTFTPRAAGEMNLKAVVKNVEGEYSVETEVSTINIAAETMVAEALVGTHTKTYDRYTPIRTYDKNSKSEWIWTKEVLGLDDKTEITSVAFPYYNTDKDITAEHFAFYLVNIDDEKDDFAAADTWTDLSEIQPLYEANNYTLKKAGSSNDPALLTLPLAKPFVYTGGNVKGIMLIEKQGAYSSYYFEYNTDANLFNSIYASSDSYDTYKTANPSRKQQYPVATLSLSVQAPTLSGTITAEEVALEGATVEAKSGNVIYTATTDAEGKYSMEIMQPELDYVVTVSAEGYNDYVSDAMTIAENTTLNCELKEVVTISINPEIGYATFYDSKNAVKIPEGVTAYVFGIDENDELGLVEYSEALALEGLSYDGVVPAGEAIVLNGAGDVVLNYAKATNAAGDALNYLLGTDKDEMIVDQFDGEGYYYALTLNKNLDPKSVGFYWMNETGTVFENKAHKAYLALPKFMAGTDILNAKNAFPFNKDANDIKNVNTSGSAQTPMFNIAGQRVNDNAKGIIIKNGKKVLKK